MTPYNQRQEDDAIAAQLRALPSRPAPPVRVYLDPKGGWLRLEGWQRTPAQTEQLIRCMGAAMAKLAAGDNACTEADLRAFGFTRAEIETHREAAVTFARRFARADA